MPNFSIIVPVYNTAKYLNKCLDSIVNQSYKNFEIIVINDGSTDNSEEVIKKYKNIKYYKTKNKGLSCARNLGVEKSKGKYLLFVDSDDYINDDLLLHIFNCIDNNPDLVRFQIKINNNIHHEKDFNNLNGSKAFEKIVDYHIVESACLYAIRKEFYLENNFSFPPYKYHEDFALIPLMILKSNIVNSINYVGYNYIIRQESITTSKDDIKNYNKALHVFEHYLFLLKELEKLKLDNKTKAIFKSYIANSAILIAGNLNKIYQKLYLNLIKDNQVINNTLNDTLIRKAKRIIFKLNPSMYVRLFK